MKEVSILGGPPVTIAEDVGLGRGASWGSDDTIMFALSTESGLFRVPAGGGQPEILTSPDAGTRHQWPDILPGGEAVLFTIQTGGNTETAQIAVLDLETDEQRVLVPGGSNPHYSPTGHIVYAVTGTLRAVPFDLARLQVTSNPVPVLEGVITKGTGAANFALATNGSLAYVAGNSVAGANHTLVWVDRAGREEPIALAAAAYIRPRLSPDGTCLVAQISAPDETDVWTSELARGTLSKLTTDPAADQNPNWTPDGERVVFVSDREDPLGFYWKAADGGEVERLVTVEDAQILGGGESWSPDGNTTAFYYSTAGTGFDIGLLSFEGEPRWTPLLQTDANEASPVISPDGRWLAYQSDETGRYEAYVQRFPELGGRQPISTNGGLDPLWSSDGRELFYRVRTPRALMAVTIESDDTSVRPGRMTLV